MPDVIEPAPSGRAKCRGCGRALAKGALRFGESLPNPFAEGEALYWFDLVCAACMRPEKFRAALDATTLEIPERDWLRETAEVGAAHRRLPRIARAERASSGRATCRHCRELIEKGTFRIALQLFDEGRMTPIGCIHVACIEGYFGYRDVVARIARLTPGLGAADLAEIQHLIDTAPPIERPPEENEPEKTEAPLAVDGGGKEQPEETPRGSGATTPADRLAKTQPHAERELDGTTDVKVR